MRKHIRAKRTEDHVAIVDGTVQRSRVSKISLDDLDVVCSEGLGLVCVWVAHTGAHVDLVGVLGSKGLDGGCADVAGRAEHNNRFLGHCWVEEKKRQEEKKATEGRLTLGVVCEKVVEVLLECVDTFGRGEGLQRRSLCVGWMVDEINEPIH